MQYERHDYEHNAVLGVPPQADYLKQRLGLQRYVVVHTRPLPQPHDQVNDNRGMQFGLRNLFGIGGGILDNVERMQFCYSGMQSHRLLSIAGVRYVLSDVVIE